MSEVEITTPAPAKKAKAKTKAPAKKKTVKTKTKAKAPAKKKTGSNGRRGYQQVEYATKKTTLPLKGQYGKKELALLAQLQDGKPIDTGKLHDKFYPKGGGINTRTALVGTLGVIAAKAKENKEAFRIERVHIENLGSRAFGVQLKKTGKK